jgi:hypothetical protein
MRDDRRVAVGAALALLLVAGCSRGAGGRAAVPMVADPPVGRLLVDACYPCHASGATRPWTGHIAPSSWTSSARTVLDFSDWATYDAARRAAALNAIAASVAGGHMPPADYTFFDHAARLTEAQRHTLVRWATAEAAAAQAH